MSSEVVEWLRARAEHFRGIEGAGFAKHLDAAADRIEALEGEVAARTAERDREHQRYLKCYDQMGLSEARAERLRAVLMTLSTDTNISQEERKFHARKALEDDKQ